MMYLCIIFVPPLYFMVRGKWGAFFLNLILYCLAWLCVLTIVGIIVAPLFWALSVGHAMWHLRKELAAEQADMIATKMAEQMVKSQKPQPPCE